MPKFYFTYGTEGFPYSGGWTEVEAETRSAACAVFRIYHPDKIKGVLNCSDIYSQEKFMATGMVDGNRGACCHEQILLNRTQIKKTPLAATSDAGV